MRFALSLSLMVAVLLAGCTDGITIGHQYTSNEWQQAGAWDALPAEGRIGDLSVSVVTFFGYDNGFHADDLDHWIDYELQFVRWHEPATEATFQTLQFEGSHMQVWVGEDVTRAQAKETFMEHAPKALDLDDQALASLWDRMVANHAFFEARAQPDSDSMHPAMWAYGASIERPDFERLYESLGGLDAMSVSTHIGASGGLPASGQVELSTGKWTLHMETAMKRVQRGASPSGDLLWVSPTDTLRSVHWNRLSMDDGEATSALQDVLLDAGLDATDRDWTFRHEAIKSSIGQGD